MNVPEKILLLNGSPRNTSSTSEILGSYLLDQIRARLPEVETEIFRVYPALTTGKGDGALLKAVDWADLVILAFPLYVDSLPVNTIRAFERIAEHRQAQPEPRSQTWMAICNAGFPEFHHCRVALEICRNFARQTGVEWAGGLALGAGGMFGGQPLKAQGGRAWTATGALDAAAAALAEGQCVPESAVTLMAKPVVPAWLYLMLADLGWYLMARSNRVLTKLRARPYLAR